MNSTKAITLRGVRVHNLKNIDAEIPLGQLTVVTGVSGAGKSSLVFDVLYAEAQRRYLQSFSTYTRQFLERFDKPDADEISDLPPAVAIRRSSHQLSPRTTVGSLTEINVHVRLLFADVGELVCPTCGQPVIAYRTADVVAALQSMPSDTRCTIAFPATIDEADQAAWLAALLEEGYSRIQVDSVIYRLGEQMPPTVGSAKMIWVLLDRVEIGKTPIDRLTESVDAAFRRGLGRMGVLTDAGETVYDHRFVCPRCQRAFTAPQPRLFDPDDPFGACPTCHGAGVVGKDAAVCSTCDGRRFNVDALAVRVGNRNIADWLAMPVRNLLEFVLTRPLPANPRLSQVVSRLRALTSLDLGFLTLQQSAAKLSDGVHCRIALTAALSSNLVNVLYLVDEPTTDLHSSDIQKLIDALRNLVERGNTVVVIEHELQVIAAADHVIDLGPGAGEEGGQITFQGPPSGLATASESPTSDFWTGRQSIDVPTKRRQPTHFLKLIDPGANLDVEFPLNVLCVVTGVSGSGKRSLIEQKLYPALCLAKKKKHAGGRIDVKVCGAQHIADVVLLDQSPLPRSSRSNPATYLKIFDEIRELFAATVDAKIRNFMPGHFSFNQTGGRCETCEGQGTLTIDMQFLADVTTTCPECQGKRYRKEILEIKVRNRNIAEVLDLTIREAFRFFRAQPAIERKLKVLLDVGLDYLRLGQAVETLAGGESQRLKLAGQLASSRKPGTLFLVIEPTAGLHPADVANLLACFDRLLSAGHSLIVIEHDRDVIACADWEIELGLNPKSEYRNPKEIRIPKKKN